MLIHEKEYLKVCVDERKSLNDSEEALRREASNNACVEGLLAVEPSDMTNNILRIHIVKSPNTTVTFIKDSAIQTLAEPPIGHLTMMRFGFGEINTMAIKINIGVPSLKKTKQIELSDEQSKALFEKRIGETIKGELVDLPGYEFEITGGSDNAGFPMRQDVVVPGRRKILVTKGTGNQDTRAGRRLRKTVAGAVIYRETAQVNLKAVKEGKQSLFEEPKAEEPAEKPAAE